MRSLRRPLTPIISNLQRGINLSGLEFSHDTLPGSAYTHYDAHQESNYAWAASNNFTIVRLPVLWERIQPTVNGELSASHKVHLDRNIAWATAHGVKVIIDIHNYGGRRIDGVDHKIGGGVLTTEDFCDLWKRLAAAYKNNPTVCAYDIMNEPSNMPVSTNRANHLTSTWTVAAQACINAIREVDGITPLIVCTDNFSGLQNFLPQYGVAPWWNDPADNMFYSCHLYIDSNNSGAYSGRNIGFAGAGRPVYYGGDLLLEAAQWCRANNIRLFIGEVGAPDTEEAWRSAIYDFYRVAHKNSDVITGITYWAYGDWYNAATAIKDGKMLDTICY